MASVSDVGSDETRFQVPEGLWGSSGRRSARPSTLQQRSLQSKQNSLKCIQSSSQGVIAPQNKSESGLEPDSDKPKPIEVGHQPGGDSGIVTSEGDGFIEGGQRGKGQGDTPEPTPTLTSTPSDTSESDSDDDADMISLDDEDEEGDGTSSELMFCNRCHNTNFAFRNRSKFLFHIRRHSFGEHFSCPTCKRPFLSLNLCVAHEIRVHGREIDRNCYNGNDRVIRAAKEYLERKKKNQQVDNGQGQLKSSNNIPHGDPGTHPGGTGSPCGGSDDDEDLDDGHIVTSSSLMTYRGPPVEHIVECYEIQLNHAPPRSYHAHNNQVTRIALENHARNVAYGHDVNRIGRFSKQNLRMWRLERDSQGRQTPPPPITRSQSRMKPMKETGKGLKNGQDLNNPTS